MFVLVRKDGQFEHVLDEKHLLLQQALRNVESQKLVETLRIKPCHFGRLFFNYPMLNPVYIAGCILLISSDYHL